MLVPILLALVQFALPAQRVPWDIAALAKPPGMSIVPTTEPGVRALFFDSVPSKGKPTRVFAYYGAPPHTRGRRLPAMVLIHGGGGTAFAEWVRMWNARGYAAIAMDTCGNVPETATPGKPWNAVKKHHPDGGPEGWGGFSQVDDPAQDQWTYHAVAAVVLAHSLIRSFPEVDPHRIGVTGISWGGYLTNIVAGVDRRFRFAAPVYGCGFLGEDSAWLKDFEKLGPDRANRWLSLWDPSHYVGQARVPMLWVTGTNDFAYPMGSLQKSYRLPKSRRLLAIRVRMPHNHPDGARPEEIYALAGALFNSAAPLPRLLSARTASGIISAQYRSTRPLAKAELNFTRDTGKWQERKWEIVPANLDAKRQKATAPVPTDARVWYLNVFDDRGLVASSEHETR